MKPLEDIRILAIEQYGAGPFGTLQLADLGAEVVKIEQPQSGGDVSRYVPPFAEDEDSLFFETFNRNKRSISLDLSNPSGREVFERLVGVFDAVCSNLRGDVPERLGLRYADLAHANPAIVCVSLSAFGATGPRRAQPGYDYMLQALAGWMSLTGEPDGPPSKSGLSLVDYSGGLVAALSILAGVHAARREGRGMDCDLSLFDVAVSLLTYPATWNLSRGWKPERHAHSAHPSIVPFQAFPTADGWMVVACPKEKFWRRLADAIERPDLLENPHFDGFAARAEHREELTAELRRVFAKHPTSAWLKTLGSAGVPCAPVNSLDEALADEQVTARQLIVDVEHPRFGHVREVASAAQVGPASQVAHRRAPRRGEDTERVLTELLRYEPAAVEDLRRAGAFGSA